MPRPPIQTTIQELPYHELGWKLFEHLCKRIIKNEEPQASDARLYLSQGHKQDGIDGYAYDPNDQKYVSFQCKCEAGFSAKKVEKAVDEFLRGKFAKKSKTFLLFVTAHINKPYEEVLESQRNRLAEKNIHFKAWDQLQLDILLKKYPQLIYEFFDGGDVPNWVKAFCGASAVDGLVKAVQVQTYLEPKAFIERPLHPLFQSSRKSDQDEQPALLTDLLIKEVLAGQCRIFVRSEAGMGKSTELLNAAYRLSIYNITLIFPVLLYLKNYSNEDLPSWLDNQQPNWRSVKTSTLLLLFDGLDEVKANERENFIRRVRGFMDAHSDCHVLISCRTNFANSQLQFDEFKAYDLRPFDKHNISDYAHKVLPADQISSFLQLVDSLPFASWLENPFSLIHFVDSFQKDPITVPRTRADLLKQVVDIKIERDQIRYYVDQPALYYQLIKRLAFVMNLMGVNSLSDSEFIILFPDSTQRERCYQSSLLQVGNRRITFEHNILQEYFSALILSDQNFDCILEYVCFLPDYKHLKPKWFNTIGILLELLTSENPLIHELIDLVSNQEPQLLLSIEYSHFGLDLRFKIFQTILRLPDRKYLPDIYRNYRLSALADISNNIDVISFLLEQAQSDVEGYQRESFYYLRFVNPEQLFGYELDLIEVIAQALRNDIPLVQESAIGLAEHLQFVDPSLLDLVTNSIPNLDQYRIRESVYQYLNSLNKAELYVDFYLAGFYVYIQNHSVNSDDSISYSTIGESFVDGLLSVTKPENLHKITSLILENFAYWEKNPTFFDHESNGKKFFDELIKKIAIAYSLDKSLYDKVILLCHAASKYFLEQLVKGITQFFELTDTVDKAFWYFFSLESNNTALLINGWIANEAILAQCLELFSKEELRTEYIWQLINMLDHAKRNDLAEQFRLNINELGLHQFVYLDIGRLKAKRNEKDLYLLANQSEFITEVGNVFNKLNANKLTRNQIIFHRYPQREESNYEHWFDHDTVVSRFLTNWRHDNGLIERTQVINYLLDKEKWDYYLTDQFLQLKAVDVKLQKQVKLWFYENLPLANFCTALTETINGTQTNWHFRQLEFMIARLFLRCDFDIPESTLLDMLHFDIYGLDIMSNRDENGTLTEKVVEKLVSSGIFQEQIIKNLTEGIKSNPVLRNHIALCKALNLSTALPLIKSLLYNEKLLSPYQQINTFLIYLELGGNLDDLAFVFSHFDAESDFHWHLLKEFVKQARYRNRIGQLLNKELEKGTVSQDDIAAIVLLTESGFEQGLTMYVQRIKAKNQVPDHTSRYIGVENLSPQFVAESMIDFLDYILTHDLPNGVFEEPIAMPISYLKLVAFKSESLYYYVYNELAKRVNEYEGQKAHFRLKYTLIHLEKEYYLQKPDYISIQEAMLAVK